MKKTVLCLGAALFLATGLAAAQSRMAGQRGGNESSKSVKKDASAANTYPNATRHDPKAQMPDSIGRTLNKINDAMAEGNTDEGLKLADEVLQDKKLTPYAQAFALYLRANMKWEKEDGAGAIADMKQAISIDALPNSNQFPAMYTLAQYQLQEEKYADALVSVDDYVKQSGDSKAEVLAIKGNAYYRLEKYQDAINSLKEAIAKSEKTNESWNQILMASYFELDQYDEAAKISEAQLAKTPTDKKLIQQLASIYVNGKHEDRALKLLADSKAKGLFTTGDDYKLLAQLYGQADKAKDGAAVLEEGFTKGVVKPSYEMYKLLGDSYALADDETKAIDAYEKASPFAKDGEADFLRGQLLVNNQKWPDARDAMKKALQRGVKRQGAAYVLLGNAENELGNKAGAIAAMEKAKGFEETRAMSENWLKMIKGGGVVKKK
ncbi:MAG: tetratricopeptide repeat protein [Tahibacter sp.]